jgi:histone acetyltransferase (RNA polymerase elongator complex component)
VASDGDLPARAQRSEHGGEVAGDRTPRTSARCTGETRGERAAAGGGEIAFYGGTFTNLPEDEQDRLLDDAAPYLASGAIRGIRLSTRPDALSPGLLRHLASRGVTTIELGVQSLDDGVLAAAGRGHTAEDARRGTAMVRDAGIRLGLQLMTNLPGDTPDRALESARGTADLGPAFVRIYPTLVLAGTDLERLWRNGTYTSWSLEETVEVVSRMAAIFRERGITIARIGLPPMEGRESYILAGPLHPRLGDLVRQRAARPSGPHPMGPADVKGVG